MQNKRKVFQWISAAVFLAGLIISALAAGKYHCEDVMLIAPVASNKSVVSAERLEDINGEDFFLTYEILSRANIRALNSNHDITLKKTNYTYRLILNYRMLSGSFFTEADQIRKQRAAVINKAAALVMFGNLDVTGRPIVIDGEQYTITGVMEDRDDIEGRDDETEIRYNVYLPASVSGDNPTAFAVQMKEGVSKESVKTEVKNLITPAGSYAFIHFGTLTDLVYGILIIAFKTVLISIFLILIIIGYGRLRTDIHQLEYFHKRLYIKEIIQQYPCLFIRVSAAAAALLLTAALILNIAFSFIGYFLIFGDTVPLPKFGDLSVFGEMASDLTQILYFSMFLFFGFLLDILLLYVSGWKNYLNGKITLQR